VVAAVTSANVKVSRADKRRRRYEQAIAPLSGRRRLAEVWRWLTSEFARLPVDRQDEVADRVAGIAADLNGKAGDR
jgi:hypothetical protein